MDSETLKVKMIQIISERKLKKMSCEQDTVQNEAMKQLQLDQETLNNVVQNLIQSERVLVNKRAGKNIFSLKEPQEQSTSQGIEQNKNFINDFHEFKEFVTKSIFTINSDIERIKSSGIINTEDRSRDELIGILEGKEALINHLYTEIKHLREQNMLYYKSNHSLLIDSNSILKQSITSLSDSQRNNINHNDHDANKHEQKNGSKEKLSKPNSHSDSVTRRESDKKKTVFIIGDSLLNGINENGLKKLSNDDVKLKCHRGATSEDLSDHLKPVIRKTPDVVIIHCGTNDLQNDIDTGENIDRMVRNIKLKSPKTKIAVSKIIVRQDKQNISKKVDELNKRLDVICGKHSIDVINHTNIKVSHLTSKKLHLNKQGSSILAKNYVSYLEST